MENDSCFIFIDNISQFYLEQSVRPIDTEIINYWDIKPYKMT